MRAALVILALVGTAAAETDKQAAQKLAEQEIARAWTAYKSGGEGDAGACSDAIDLAMYHGVLAEDDVAVPAGVRKLAKGAHRVAGAWRAPIGQLRTLCDALRLRTDERTVERHLVIADAKLQPLADLHTRAAESDDPLEDAAHLVEGAEATAATCRSAVAGARENGVAADRVFTLKRSGKVTLAGAAEVCDALDAAAQKVRVVEALKVERRLEAYKRTLKGDKRNVFVEERLIGAPVYGSGGRLLETPEELQAAKVWFVVATAPDARGRVWWTLRRYAFDKRGALNGTDEHSGCCDAPPKKLYK